MDTDNFDPSKKELKRIDRKVFFEMAFWPTFIFTIGIAIFWFIYYEISGAVPKEQYLPSFLWELFSIRSAKFLSISRWWDILLGATFVPLYFWLTVMGSKADEKKRIKNSFLVHPRLYYLSHFCLDLSSESYRQF